MNNFSHFCNNLNNRNLKNLILQRLFFKDISKLLIILFSITLLFGCKKSESNITFERHYLNSEYRCVKNQWEFKYQGKWYPATVPGNIHDDLIANKLIDNPFDGNNEASMQWISDSIWEYRIFFDKNFNNKKTYLHNQLVFEGLDTYSEVFLNGEKLSSTFNNTLTNNMFRKWIFPLSNNLNETSNELVVRFYPSLNFDSIESSKLPFKLPDNRVFTRKAQYQNGWDWGPKLNTCGIWKNVYIESWNNLKINDFQIFDVETSLNPSRPWIAQVEIDILAEKMFSTEVLVEISDEDGYSQSIKQKVNLRQGNNMVKIPITIENPKLWWPNGYGNQHLYYFTISTVDAQSDNYTPLSHSHGLRTIRLEQKSDSIGESFLFYVNEKPIFMRGVNWIPASSFPGTLARIDGEEIYAKLLQKCADANMTKAHDI